jgi:hypothetical protein
VERWVRALGPGWLWLGPALRARLGEDPLASLSTVEVGPAVRIDVRDPAAVEAALADLLPTAADWQQGMERRYGSG